MYMQSYTQLDICIYMNLSIYIIFYRMLRKGIEQIWLRGDAKIQAISHPEKRRASQWASNSPGSQSTILSFRKPTINQPFGQLCCEIDDKTTHQQTRRWSKQVMNQRSGAMMKPTEVPLAHDQEKFASEPRFCSQP